MTDATRLSDAEDLALRTMWRDSGFVDAQSATFNQRSRFYRWRFHLAVLLGTLVVVTCWAAPGWIVQNLSVHTQAQAWFEQYVLVRGAMAACWTLAALYCWLRKRNLLVFWVGLTIYLSAMWGLDRWLVVSSNWPGAESEGHIWPLRVVLIGIGLLNIWRHAFAPLPSQRGWLSTQTQARA